MSGSVWIVVVGVLLTAFLAFELPARFGLVPWRTLSEVVWSLGVRRRREVAVVVLVFGVDLASHFAFQTPLTWTSLG